MSYLHVYNMDINNNIETNYDSLKKPTNFKGVSNGELRTSSTTRSNNVNTPAFFSVAAGCSGNSKNDQRHTKNISDPQNNFTNLLYTQPNNTAEMYVPVVCFLPVRRRHVPENQISLLAHKNSLNSLVPKEDSKVKSSFQKNDAATVLPDKEQTAVSSISSFNDESICCFYDQEMGTVCLNQVPPSTSTDTDITSSQHSQSLPSTDSSLGSSGQYSSSSTGSASILFSSSFEDLIQFPIMNAPLDCLWDESTAATSPYSLPSSDNIPSLKDALQPINDVINEVIRNAQTQLQPETSETLIEQLQKNDHNNYSIKKEFIGPAITNINVEGNIFASHSPSTDLSGAVPKAFNNQFTNSLVVEDGGNSKYVTRPYCNFCFKNKEPAYLYESHTLKSENGNIVCPILRNYTCPLCGASGDFAHTLSYCPVNRQHAWYEPMQLGGKDSEHSTVQFHSTPNTEMASSSYYNNNEKELRSSTNAEAYSSNQNQLIQSAVQSLSNNLFSMPDNNRTKSPAISYNRLGCAFPAVNIFKKKKETCKFCLRNREPDYVYNSHQLRDRSGRVICPYLRRFVCRICGATGDTAHTRKYCPQNTYDDFIQKFMDQ